MITRRNKILTDEDIAKIAGTYPRLAGEGGVYEDTPVSVKLPRSMRSGRMATC